MTEAAHTPGPWWIGISGYREEGPVPASYIGPGYYRNLAVFGANGVEVVGCDEYHIFECAADVSLISAAPDLLKALEYLVSLGGGDALDHARAAIRKAKGDEA